MPGYCRFAGVRQTEFAQAGSAFARGQVARISDREKTIDKGFFDFLPREFRTERSSDERAPGAENINGNALEAAVAEQFLFRGAALPAQGVLLAKAQFRVAQFLHYSARKSQ